MKKSYIIELKNIGDISIGYLVVLEENKNIAFNIKRVYYSYDVPKGVKRGFHAHKNLQQILICINGKVKIKCFDGKEEKEYLLDSPKKGLYIGEMIWHEMYEYNKETILLVLASDFYDEDDYIRNYKEFLEICNEVNYKKINYIDNKKFIHEDAIVDSENIGRDTRIWGFSHIFKDAIIGENCNICEHTLVENDVTIGNNVTIKSGVYIWDGVRIKDNAFVGPCVTFINDRHPRSKVYQEKIPETEIKEWASIGANSTIMCGITIGKASTVGAGSVVLKDVGDYEVVVGNPAKMIGYNCICTNKLYFTDNDIYTCECGKKYKKTYNKIELLKEHTND